MPRFLLALAALLFAGCGYVGDPLPPLANVPIRIGDLIAVQRGARILIQFTVPTLTTENHPIPGPVQLDLRAGTADQFDENEWAARARQLNSTTIASHIAHSEIPAAAWIGKAVIFGVRIIGGNGKQSGWSNFAVVPVLAPPAKPTDIAAVATAGGVRLTWRAPGAEFRVFRKMNVPSENKAGENKAGENKAGVNKAGDEKGEEKARDYALAATVPTPEWLDAAAEYGKRYSYMVQTLARQDNTVAESDFSEPVSLTPVDTFPPAAPTGVRATTAPHSIELNWERNSEPDLSAYRVYRATAGGAFEKLADVSAVPSYSDRAVEHGKTYRYAVTAVDSAENESPRSPGMEVILP